MTGFMLAQGQPDGLDCSLGCCNLSAYLVQPGGMPLKPLWSFYPHFSGNFWSSLLPWLSEVSGYIVALSHIWIMIFQV